MLKKIHSHIRALNFGRFARWPMFLVILGTLMAIYAIYFILTTPGLIGEP